MNKYALKVFLKIILIVFLIYILFIPKKTKRSSVELKPITPAPAALTPAEQNNIKIFEQVSPAIVSIKNASLHRDFFSLNVYEVPQGAGSGIIWDNNGHILTNFHVIYQADKIEVSLSSGFSYPAKIIGTAPDYDLALLKIETKEKLTSVMLGTSNNLRVGQYVFALGNPFGLDGTITQGIISALGRTIDSMTGHKIHDVIQTDAAINPGNSGGALLDVFGRVIGINTAILSTSGVSSGIGFAIPVDTVNRIVSRLIENKKITRAGMGITLIPDNIRNKFGVDGAMILKVLPNSPAYKNGLRGTTKTLFGRIIPGDLIKKINNTEISSNEDLIYCLENKHSPGEEVKIIIQRQDSLYQITLKLIEIES